MKGRRNRMDIGKARGASRRPDKTSGGPRGLYQIRRFVEAQEGLGSPKDVREVQKRPEKYGGGKRLAQEGQMKLKEAEGGWWRSTRLSRGRYMIGEGGSGPRRASEGISLGIF